MKTPHTSCRRGKRVRVKLADGTKFIDKFKEKVGKHVYFDHHEVLMGEIRSFTIVKGNPSYEENTI